MYEDSIYHLWYTGYADNKGDKQLGYATSPDGENWTRYQNAPLLQNSWVEDMCVFKVGSTYFMAAEGEHDWAHLLTSDDRVNWTDHGSFQIF